MRASRSAALVVQVTLLAGALAGALAACGGGSDTKERSVPTPSPLRGEAAKPAATIIADARAALLATTSVHIEGTFIQSSSSSQRLDLRLTRVKGQPAATGSVTTVTRSGAKSTTVTLALIRLGSRLYVRGDRSYYARIGPKAAAVAGHWLSLPIAQDKSVADLTDLATLAAGFSSGTAVSVSGTAQLGAQRVVVVSAGAGATVFVAAAGTPLPLRLQRTMTTSSTIAGTLDFGEYDAALRVTAPAGAIDIARVR